MGREGEREETLLLGLCLGPWVRGKGVSRQEKQSTNL